MNVFFRVDYSTRIGLGHLSRCLTLADGLKKIGFTVFFICRTNDNLNLVKRSGHELIQLKEPKNKNEFINSDYSSWLSVPWQKDAEETINAISHLTASWLVVDHYALGFQWEKKLSNHCQRILVIDDLMNRKHDCDLLVDSNFGRKTENYADFVSESTNVFTGTDFVILRPEFESLRKTAKQIRQQSSQIKIVLVFLGGGDPDNITQTILAALSQVSWSSRPKINVVLGAANEHEGSIRKLLLDYPLESEIFIDTPSMAELMLEADLAIGAAGGATWERCCLGLPTISIAIAENQQYANQVLVEAGVVITLDSKLFFIEGIVSAVEEVINNPQIRQKLSENSFQLVDGKGVQRIIRNMKEMEH